MNTLYSQLVSLIGEPPNDYIQFAYYLLILFAIVHIIELIFYLFKCMFNIKL